jgi:hypothetical protein
MQPDATAQSTKTVENYNILNPGKEYIWMPVVHYKGSKNFYAEARYNYEDINTASVYGGKSFTGGKKMSFSITPMAGLVFGKYKGVSAGLNSEADYGGLNFSSQLQYTINTKNKMENFFYNWVEISHSFLKKMYAGISLQQTILYKNGVTTAPGILLGFSSGNITVPLYLFNPASKQKSAVLGLIVEWQK